MTKKIDDIIEKECYEGIRDQDGWETLELTVREDYPLESEAILQALGETETSGAYDMTSHNAFDEPGEKATTHPWAAAARW